MPYNDGAKPTLDLSAKRAIRNTTMVEIEHEHAIFLKMIIMIIIKLTKSNTERLECAQLGPAPIQF